MSDTVLVSGSGYAALEAAREVVVQGGRAVVVRSSGAEELRSLRTPNGIEIVDNARLVRLDGAPGRFTATVRCGGEDLTIECGAVIIAPGQYERALSGDGVMSLREAQVEGVPGEVNGVAIVLTPRSARPSFIAAVRLARSLLTHRPRPSVHLFAEEMQAYGTDELEYRQVQEEGAVVVRTSGRVEVRTGPLEVRAMDFPSGLEVKIQPDLLVIDHGLEEGRTTGLLGIAGHPSMGAVSTMKEGVFTPGMEGDLLLEEMRTRARAAASRALTVARSPIHRVGSAAVVDRDRCSACLTCSRNCPFGAPHPAEEGKASIDPGLCQGCGICVAACPSRALSLPDEGGTLTTEEGR
jgi:heterodisulfide reductase subunit A